MRWLKSTQILRDYKDNIYPNVTTTVSLETHFYFEIANHLHVLNNFRNKDKQDK